MNKSYLVVPLVGVLVFGAVYWSYSEQRQTAQQTEEAHLLQVRHDQAERTQLAQASATASANAALSQRQKERLEKEQREAEQKAALHAAEHHRDHAFELERKIRGQLEHRRADLEHSTTRLNTLAQRQQELTQESAFLADYLRQAAANQDSLYQLLEKLDAAERAHATAATAPATPARPGNI